MAPLSKRVIRIVTAMLETLEENPDAADEEVDALIKSTLLAISTRKPSTIRALGDAFLNFADEKPILACAVVITIWAVPQQIVMGIWRTVYPQKVQVEVSEPATGLVKPIVESLLRDNVVGISFEGDNDANSIANLAPQEIVEVTTPGGTTVSWTRGDAIGISRRVFAGGGRGGGGGYRVGSEYRRATGALGYTAGSDGSTDRLSEPPRSATNVF